MGRSQSYSVREMIRQIAAEPDSTYPAHNDRPRTRGECEDGPRPCPYVSCKHHLYLDVLVSGSLLLTFPELEPWELAESCALDVADRGEATLEEIAGVMNITRQRVQQVETKALIRFRTEQQQQEVTGRSVEHVGDLPTEAAVARAALPEKLRKRSPRVSSRTMVDYQGQTQTIAAWSAQTGISVYTLRWRYVRHLQGLWTLDAVFTPLDKGARRAKRCG